MNFRFQRKYLSIPYILFLLFFVVTPIALILYYAFTDQASGAISLNNLIKFFSDETNVNVLVISLVYGLINTAFGIGVAVVLSYIVTLIFSPKAKK